VAYCVGTEFGLMDGYKCLLAEQPNKDELHDSDVSEAAASLHGVSKEVRTDNKLGTCRAGRWFRQ